MATWFYTKCTFYEQTFMFHLTPSLTSSDLVNNMSCRFGLRLRSFTLSYSLPDYRKCLLSSDSKHIGHVQIQCPFRADDDANNQAAEDNSDSSDSNENPRNDSTQFLQLPIGYVQENSSSSEANSSEDRDLLPLSRDSHERHQLGSIVIDHVSGQLLSLAVGPAPPMSSSSEPDLATDHLVSGAEVDQLLPLNNTPVQGLVGTSQGYLGTPISPDSTYVEPYIPVPISQAHARGLQTFNSGQTRILSDIHRQPQTTGIIFRDSTTTFPTDSTRPVTGKGKHPLSEFKDDDRKKKGKANVTKISPSTIAHQLELESKIQATPLPIINSENWSVLQNTEDMLQLPDFLALSSTVIDFSDQNLCIGDLDTAGFGGYGPIEEQAISIATERSMLQSNISVELDSNFLDVSVLHFEPKIPITRLSEPSARISPARPNANGVRVNRYIPITALPHKIFRGGRGTRQMSRMRRILNPHSLNQQESEDGQHLNMGATVNFKFMISKFLLLIKSTAEYKVFKGEKVAPK